MYQFSLRTDKCSFSSESPIVFITKQEYDGLLNLYSLLNSKNRLYSVSLYNKEFINSPSLNYKKLDRLILPTQLTTSKGGDPVLFGLSIFGSEGDKERCIYLDEIRDVVDLDRGDFVLSPIFQFPTENITMERILETFNLGKSEILSYIVNDHFDSFCDFLLFCESEGERLRKNEMVTVEILLRYLNYLKILPDFSVVNDLNTSYSYASIDFLRRDEDIRKTVETMINIMSGGNLSITINVETDPKLNQESVIFREGDLEVDPFRWFGNGITKTILHATPILKAIKDGEKIILARAYNLFHFIHSCARGRILELLYKFLNTHNPEAILFISCPPFDTPNGPIINAIECTPNYKKLF